MNWCNSYHSKNKTLKILVVLNIDILLQCNFSRRIIPRNGRSTCQGSGDWGSVSSLERKRKRIGRMVCFAFTSYNIS